MTDQHALALIRRGDSDGLSALIERYTGYVSTIVWNIANGALSVQDIEEITADVFVALWQSRPDVRKARPYLGAMARNAARRALSKKGHDLPLEEDRISVAADPADILDDREQAACLRRAIGSTKAPDDEIFLTLAEAFLELSALYTDERQADIVFLTDRASPLIIPGESSLFFQILPQVAYGALF